VQKFLSRLGHTVQVAPDGSTGIAAAKEIRPDAVISDLGLPGIVDGYAVAVALRIDPSLRHVYLIALSGFGRTKDRQRTREAVFNKHLVKPMDLLALQNALAEKSSTVRFIFKRRRNWVESSVGKSLTELRQLAYGNWRYLLK
jgi:CheY-like chemotaxis protein